MNDRPAWYVWTTICDCNKVAASIFSGNMVSDEAWEAHFHGQPFDDADPERGNLAKRRRSWPRPS